MSRLGFLCPASNEAMEAELIEVYPDCRSAEVIDAIHGTAGLEQAAA
jgi:hypothetical protein